MEILSREVINVQGTGAIHKPVQRSSYCWDGPTDFGLIENTGSKLRELLKSRNEARSFLKKFPEDSIKESISLVLNSPLYFSLEIVTIGVFTINLFIYFLNKCQNVYIWIEDG